MRTSRWLLPFRADHGARIRLVCVPGAGSSASMYYDWVARLPAWADVYGVVLPGRGPRVREAPMNRMDTLADALAEALAQREGPPTVLFGHSLGALVAYETADRLRGRTDLVAALAVAAHKAPALGSAGLGIPSGDDELLHMVAKLGATPPKVLDHPEIRRLALPGLRADFELDATYRHRERRPLTVPLTVYGGADDSLVSTADLEAWRSHTSGPFALRTVRGGHFFHTGPHAADLFADLAALAERHAAPTPPSGTRAGTTGPTDPTNPTDPTDPTGPRRTHDVRG